MSMERLKINNKEIENNSEEWAKGRDRQLTEKGTRVS